MQSDDARNREYKIKILPFLTCDFFFLSRSWNNGIVEMCQNFQCEMRVAEEYWWAMTQAMGQSCYGSSGSSVLELDFDMYSWLYVYSVLTCAKFDLGHIFQYIPIAYVEECLYTSRKCSPEITSFGCSYLAFFFWSPTPGFGGFLFYLNGL